MVDAFRQAEAQYSQLCGDLAAGRINIEQFRNLLNQLRVTDAQGRTWMLQEGSGQWFVWINGQWQAASPYPSMPNTPPPATTGYAVAGSYSASSGQPPFQQALPPLEGGWGHVFGAMLWVIPLAFVIFALIGVAIAAFSDSFEYSQIPQVMWLPAAISIVISFFGLSSQWRGRVEGFVDKRERHNTGDDDYTYETVRYARLRLENGRLKDVRPMGNWQVGDVIEKRRGAWGPRKL